MHEVHDDAEREYWRCDGCDQVVDQLRVVIALGQYRVICLPCRDRWRAEQSERLGVSARWRG